MRSFTDAADNEWMATAHEEATPRHHTRWFLVFQPAGKPDTVFAMPEVRWQTLQTAERTIDAMSVFELRKRLDAALRRAESVSGLP